VVKAQAVWAEVTVDCRDTQLVSAFWGALLDLPVKATKPEGWFFLGPTVEGGPVLNFQPVPEEKVGKSRIHLDVWVADLAVAVRFVQELGGRSTGETHSYSSGEVVVMADPEGNEFCLVGGSTP
jgi:predicted enzyme related to lactoylglutathione lyase